MNAILYIALGVVLFDCAAADRNAKRFEDEVQIPRMPEPAVDSFPVSASDKLDGDISELELIQKSFEHRLESPPPDDEEMVNVKVRNKSNGTVSVSFMSHGKQHHLDLTESRTQLKDVDVRLLGASEVFKQDVLKEMKETKLMTDSRKGAMVAFHMNNGSLTSIKRGIFQLGRHQFEMRPENGQGRDKVRVKRKVVNNLGEHERYSVEPRNFQRSKKAIPESVEPISATVELVMILDYSIWNTTLSGDVSAENETSHMISLLLYYAHIADTMNSYYKTMKNDDISVTVDLAGLVVLTTSLELPHLVEDHVLVNSYIHAERTLERFSAWLNTSESRDVFPPGDHFMLFTGYDLYVKENSKVTLAVLGLAWTGMICDVSRSSSFIESAGILSFEAVTATHELGHSLGSRHDGVYSSVACADENYIMAAYTGSKEYLANRFMFSCCSQRAFYATIYQSGSCLMSSTTNTSYPSSIDDKVTAYLPGQIFDADDQCYIAMETAACTNTSYTEDTSICLKLWCVDPSNASECVTFNTAAADGTSCGDNKWCSLGACVDEGTSGATIDQKCNVDECLAGEARCTNGVNSVTPAMLQCYHSNNTCDCYDDCTDGSDEVGCNMNCSCLTGFTKCTDGFSLWNSPPGVLRYCVFDAWICDGEVDCTDASDELSCETNSNSTPVIGVTTTPAKSSTITSTTKERTTPTTTGTTRERATLTTTATTREHTTPTTTATTRERTTPTTTATTRERTTPTTTATTRESTTRTATATTREHTIPTATATTRESTTPTTTATTRESTTPTTTAATRERTTPSVVTTARERATPTVVATTRGSTTPTTSNRGECQSCRRAGSCVTSVSLCEWICPANVDCSKLLPTTTVPAKASINQLNKPLSVFFLLLGLYGLM